MRSPELNQVEGIVLDTMLDTDVVLYLNVLKFG